MPTQEEILAALAAAKAGANTEENKTPEKSDNSDEQPQPSPAALVAVEEYDELADLHNQASVILSQYGVLSNIPIDSAYWGLMNRIRSLRNSNA